MNPKPYHFLTHEEQKKLPEPFIPPPLEKEDQWEEEAARLGLEIIQLKNEVAYLTSDRDNERKHSYERLDRLRAALAESDKFREDSERWKKAYEELQSNLNEMIKRLERLGR